MLKISIIDNKDSEIMKNEVVKILKKFKPILKTITSGNDKDPRFLLELAKQFSIHQVIVRTLEINYFFARPYYNWEMRCK